MIKRRKSLTDDVEEAEINVHSPEEVSTCELGKLESSRIGLIPTQGTTISNNNDTGEEHEGFHLSPIKVTRSILVIFSEKLFIECNYLRAG